MRMRVSKRLSNILKVRKFCYLPVLAIVTVGLSAQVSPAASDLPSKQQVVAFLADSIDWYHHCAIEGQIAIEPVDLVFLEDSRPGAAQILQLSFDFARTDAQFSPTPTTDSQKGSAIATGSPDLAQFVKLEDNTESQRRQASEEIEAINKNIKTAHGAHRRELQAALEATQSRLDVLQAGLATLQQLVEFMQAFTSRETGDLASTIDDLARTVPEVTSPTTVTSPTQTSAPFLSAKSGDSGILALSSEVSALGRKISILDDETRRTDNLSQSSDELRNPLLAAINKRLPALAENALQGSDPADLQRQKARLDELAAMVKTLSPAIVALDKQRVLLGSYTSRLKKSGVPPSLPRTRKCGEYLISRLLGAALVIGALVITGAIVRRVTRRHLHDADGRHIALVIQRVVLWSTIVAVAAFAFASDLTSLATFFGLLAAGVAVALQSVILSAVGYFVLVGRRGIKVGDRVQISGVTGDVTDIGWLQFQLNRFYSNQQPTGNVVTFSNSFVLASPATGLSKFKRNDLKSAQLEDAAKVPQSLGVSST